MAKRATAAPASDQPVLGGSETRYPVEFVCKFLGADEARVRTLSRQGHLPPVKDGQLPLVRTTQQFVAWLEADLITLSEAATALSFTPPRILQLVDEGWIKRQQDGSFRRRDVYEGFIAFRREAERKGQVGASESRVRDARATEIELRLAVRRRELIPVADAEAGFAHICGMVRENLDGFAARVTRDRLLRLQIEREVNECLRKISERAGAVGAALEAGREVFETGDEPVA